MNSFRSKQERTPEHRVSEDTLSGVVLEFRGVRKLFGPKQFEAVRDINLTVKVGEIMTLVGPSGCGKSTLLNMAAGLYPTSGGTLVYRGRPVQGINGQLGYMTQADHLLPWRTLHGNVAIPLEIARRSKEEIASVVEQLIAQVGLTGFENSYPSQLSGGMRKRAALARLLAYNPETLLMDEPFGALDAQMRLLLQVEVRRLCRRLHKTVLFVTHDVDEAIAMGDRCAVFSARPGTITSIIDVDLPADRDIRNLRSNPHYIKQCADLWRLLTPAIEAQAATQLP